MPSYNQEFEDKSLLGTKGNKGEDADIRFFDIEYSCEECDYRWRIKQKASLSEENRTGSDRWFVDDSNICCPMCGSVNTTRV